MRTLFVILLCFQTIVLFAQAKTDPENQSKELGKVTWYRDYDEALEVANNEGKPILILFQEVPGCQTCRNYGHNVLSHPMMIEGIENLFIPLAIYNNKAGKDREVLNKYNEPTWNNPVVRIIDTNGKNLVERVAGNYSTRGLYTAMVKALKTQKKEIPGYFKLYGQEINATNATQEKTYQMYCFWSGEKILGAKEGVLETKAGFRGGAEVVNVKYDPSVVKESELTSYAQQANIKPTQTSEYIFSEKDHLFYLKKTNYKYLPLTDLQKTKINSALGLKQNADTFLSPKQKIWLKNIDFDQGKQQMLYLKDIKVAWWIKNGV